MSKYNEESEKIDTMGFEKGVIVMYTNNLESCGFTKPWQVMFRVNGQDKLVDLKNNTVTDVYYED